MQILGMIKIEILLTFVYFLGCTAVQCKDALFIYWDRHGHECSRIWKLSGNFTLIQCIKIVSRLFGPRYIGDNFFRAEIYWGRLLTLIKDEVLITVGCPIFPSILIPKNLFTGSLKNRSIDNLETQKKYISMKNSQFFNYLLCKIEINLK